MKKFALFASVAVALLLCICCADSKSQYERAVEHLDSLQVAMDACKTKYEWSKISAKIIEYYDNPLFDNGEDKYTEAQADTINAKAYKLLRTSILKQSEIWETDPIKLSVPEGAFDSLNDSKE